MPVFRLIADNYLIGTLPYFASTSLSTVDFSGNYFSGSPQIFINDEEVDIEENGSFTFSFKQNCFDYAAPEGSENTQRSQSECSAFCDASQPLGACGGLGYCSLDDSGNSFCECDTGFIVSATGTMCISRE